MTDVVSAWKREWVSPTVVVALLGILGTAYAAFMVQRVRIQALEVRIAAVEQDYQRSEVVRVQLDAIIQRLAAIESAVNERRATP